MVCISNLATFPNISRTAKIAHTVHTKHGMRSYAVEVQLLRITILGQFTTSVALVGIVKEWNELSSASKPFKTAEKNSQVGVTARQP